MSKEKPSAPKGTRDFGPAQMIRRKFIFQTIEDTFKRYGFLPIETPAMENLDTLLGKYGEEGDKLLFKILNSGDFLKGLPEGELQNADPVKISMLMCDRGLRYDLTVPFARYVVQYRNEISFPFRRYQIQPVWRADKPQKGRYREFYQCDVDVVGSNSLLNEVEMLQIADEVFSRLGIPVTIRMNNRKILAGMAGVLGVTDRLSALTVAVDKLEKVGIGKVKEELHEKGIAPEVIARLQPVLEMKGTAAEKLRSMRRFLEGSHTGLQGLCEIEEVFGLLEKLEIKAQLEFDLSLARGLDYYTGAIIEVVTNEIRMGSLCGGGRYDDLTGIFGLENVSGVGISFGADRIYDVMEQLDSFPDDAVKSTRLLFVNFGTEEVVHCLRLLQEIRRAGINAEIYPDQIKLKKQMNYADNRKIPFVALVGDEEIKNHRITIKNMFSGEQKSMSLPELIDHLRT